MYYMKKKEIDFYFDPICPWCWNTSRWIKEVEKQRDLNIHWKSFSLYKKNEDNLDDLYREISLKTHKMLRLIEAARSKYGDDIIDSLYTKLGILVHYSKKTDEEDIRDILPDNLDKDYLISAMEDISWDKVILDSMQDAFDIVGNDVGTPIIVIKSKNKDLGYFGPVITQVPTGDKALSLWDSFIELCEYEHFYEIKRVREEDPILPEI